MLADNWALCLPCLDKAKKNVMAREVELYTVQYGKVPPEEFIRLRAEIEQPDTAYYRTFRENWEIYNDDGGTVSINYHGYCTECGAHAEHVAEVEVEGPS